MPGPLLQQQILPADVYDAWHMLVPAAIGTLLHICDLDGSYCMEKAVAKH